MVALRHPGTGAWFTFRPRSLLFGAETSVIRYHCFSRILGILINRIFGIPLVAYFDDLGSMPPSEIEQLALNTAELFLIALGVFPKKDKAGLGREMTSLGLLGSFPGPENEMTLETSLPDDKKRPWAEMILRILRTGAISRDDLESLIWRLSFSQTSLFGRFWQTYDVATAHKT